MSTCIESERYVADKSAVQIDETLGLPQPFALHYGDVLPDGRVVA
jgi:hypothetical protein